MMFYDLEVSKGISVQAVRLLEGRVTKGLINRGVKVVKDLAFCTHVLVRENGMDTVCIIKDLTSHEFCFTPEEKLRYVLVSSVADKKERIIQLQDFITSLLPLEDSPLTKESVENQHGRSEEQNFRQCCSVEPTKNTGEDSGGSCDYYRVTIDNPTTEDQEKYTAECNDVIEALNMTYAEANMFKEIWRSASARTLGKKKAGHTSLRGAEKIEFFAKRNLIQKSKQV